MRANKTIQDYLKSFHKDEMVVLRRGDKIRDNAVLLLSPMEMELLIALAYDRAMRRERRFLDRLDPLALSDEELMRYYRFPRRYIFSDLGLTLPPHVLELQPSTHLLQTPTGH